MTVYLVFVLAFATSAATPGPEIAALLSRSLSGGLVSSLPLALGIMLGKLLLLTAAVVGLTTLVHFLGPLFIVLKVSGAGYLVWLGIKKWKHAQRVLGANEKPPTVNPVAEIGLGLTMTLSNPIAIVFYLALLPGVIDVSGVSLTSYLILCSLLLVVMSGIVIGYGLLAEAARKLFSSSHTSKWFDRTAGVIMLGAAIMIMMH